MPYFINQVQVEGQPVEGNEVKLTINGATLAYVATEDVEQFIDELRDLVQGYAS